MDNNACTWCCKFNFDKWECRLDSTRYAIKPGDLNCPYFLTRECSPQKGREEIFVRMLATLEDIALGKRDENYAEWAQKIARRMVKMARGES